MIRAATKKIIFIFDYFLTASNVLSDQQSKTQLDLVYSNIKKENPQIAEADEVFDIFDWKQTEMINQLPQFLMIDYSL